MNRQCLIYILLIALVLPASVAVTQTRSNYDANVSELSPGVVVEAVAKSTESEKADLHEGDIILSWSRGDSRGAIESPFDLSWIEISQAPLGTVKLEGGRGAAKRVWVLDRSDWGGWGLTVRPNFTGEFVGRYREAQRLGESSEGVQIVAAARRWKELADQYPVAEVRWVQSWLFFHAAELLKSARQWKEADVFYQSAIQSASTSGSAVRGQLLRAWARAYLQRSDWANAEKYLQQSNAEIEGIEGSGGGGLLIAANLNSLASISRQRGQLDKSEEYARRELDIGMKLTPDGLAVATSLGNLGIVAWRRGDLERSEEYFRQTLEIRRRLVPGTLDVAASLNNLGLVAYNRGDLERSEEYYRQALEIQEKLAPVSLDVAAGLNNLGVVVYDRGDLAKAEQYHQRSLAIREKLAPGSLDVATSLIDLGIVAYDRGDFAKAEQYHRRALEIQEKLAPESLDVATSLNNLGMVEHDRGELVQAEQTLQRSLAIREKLAPGSLDVATSFRDLGLNAYDRGELVQAEQYYRQALVIEEKLAPESLVLAGAINDLGNVLLMRGDLAPAEQYQQRALAICEKLAPESSYIVDVLRSLGDWAHKSGDTAKAEQYYGRAVAILEKLAPDSRKHAETLAAIASLLRDRQQLDAAAGFYMRALRALESATARLGGSEETRSRFRASHSDIYREYVDLLLAQKQPERALEVLERSRARVLIERLVAAGIDIRKGADSALLQQERSLQELLAAKSDRRVRLMEEKKNEQRVAAFTHEIADLEQQYQEVEERLRLSSPAYAALTRPRPQTAAEIQHLLGPDVLLLEYSLGETRSHVFAVTASSLSAFELGKGSEVEREAKEVYRLMTEPSRTVKGEDDLTRRHRLAQANAKLRKAAAQLGRMVLGPLVGQVTQRKLVVVADGALQYIPFAALPTPDSSSATTDTPLIMRHEVVNLPSASVLASLPQKAKNNERKELAIFADPVFDVRDPRVKSPASQPSASAETVKGYSRPLVRSIADTSLGQIGEIRLPRLPFTRDEADAILATLPPGAAMEAVGFDASRKLATSPELGRYRAVHFATHALVDNIHPDLSGLVLSLVDSAGQPIDGFLDLQDIYNLDLSADLVVLSACETALGKEVQGEGLIGITRAFMYAGAPRVVATLWKVEDFATAKLMAHFYKAMERDGMTPAAALRHAQLNLLREGVRAAPYYWAGFIIQGDWR